MISSEAAKAAWIDPVVPQTTEVRLMTHDQTNFYQYSLQLNSLIIPEKISLSLSLKLTPYIFPPFSLFIYFYLSFCPKHTITKCGIEVARELSVVLAMDEKESFCRRHVRDPCHAFRRRCGRLVKEQRARFYILRRCVTMLICWRECHDP